MGAGAVRETMHDTGQGGADETQFIEALPSIEVLMPLLSFAAVAGESVFEFGGDRRPVHARSVANRAD